MISDSDIRRVREATDLVQLVGETVVLRQKGREFWGCCPFHDEKTASFKVDPRSQLFKCFGCQVGGDAFGYVMRTQNLEFPEAVRVLAERSNINITEQKAGGLSRDRRTRLMELMAASADFYARELTRSKSADAAAARDYLGQRSLGSALAKRWQLGFAPGHGRLLEHLRATGFTQEECLVANMALTGKEGRPRDRFYGRIMFPVADVQGRIIAFGGRTIGAGEPKYLNTSDTPLFHKGETLYALDRAKARITSTGTAIVVEGYTDTIAMHEAGFSNTVATLGTALTPQHLKLLNRFAKRVIYLFDGDEAGKRAAVRATQLISSDITPEAGRYRFTLEVAELPAGKDPAELLAEPEGTAAMQRVLESAVPLLKYGIAQSLVGANLSTPEGRTAALLKALALLLPLRGSSLAAEYIANELAPQVGMDYDTAMATFARMQAPREQTPREPAANPHSTAAAAGAHADNTGQNNAPAQAPQSTGLNLQRELLLLYIEFSESRPVLAEAFAQLAWSTDEFALLARGLVEAGSSAESAELYALALQLAPSAAAMLSGGITHTISGSVPSYAQLLVHLYQELQLQNEIALARIAFARLEAGSAKNTLFEEIVHKQAQLATIREQLAEIPKTGV